MKAVFAVLTTLLTFPAIIYGHFGCGTDRLESHTIHQDMNVKPKTAATTGLTLEGRAQGDSDGSDVFNNLRIHFDTSQLELDWATYSQRDYFSNDVIPAVRQWLQQVFMVRPVDGPLIFTANGQATCGSGAASVTIPSTMFDGQGSGLTDTDIVIYVRGNPTLDSDTKCRDVMGFAAYCRTNSRGRPIAGYINLCRSTIQERVDTGVLTWEEVNTLLVHQTFHVFGFSTDGFQNFVDDAGQPLGDSNVWQTVNRRGKDRTELILPTVVEKAREFYGCSTLTGLEVEEFNLPTGISSHWENRVVPYDVMISYVPLASPFSTFTLAVFADSGWYQINWEYAQQSPYGRNEGCGFFDDECVGSSQQSSFEDVFCGREGVGVGSCKIPIGNSFCKGASNYSFAIASEHQYFGSSTLGGDNGYPDYCPLFELYNNGDCREVYAGLEASQSVDLTGGLYAQNSKCAAVESSNPANGVLTSCYPTECVRDAVGDYVATRLTMYRNYQRTLFDVLTCWADESGQAKSLAYIGEQDYGFSTFYCPDFERICYDESPWICKGHGTLFDGNCVCAPGYFGRDCSIAYTAANRAVYDDTSSTSVYDSEVCPNAQWSYQATDDNVGVLSLSLTLNPVQTYFEDSVRTAIRIWVAIVTDISLCDVSLQSYSYAYGETAGSVTATVWYYTTLTTWTETSGSVQSAAFDALKLGTVFDVEETKIVDGTHDDNITENAETTIQPTADPIAENAVRTLFGVCALQTAACTNVSQNAYCCNYIINSDFATSSADDSHVSQEQLFGQIKTVRDLNIASMASDYFFVLVAFCTLVGMKVKGEDFVTMIKPILLSLTVVGSVVDVAITFTIVDVISRNDMIGAMQLLYDNQCYADVSDQTLLELKGQFETVLVLDVVEGVLDVISLLLLIGGFVVHYFGGDDYSGCSNFAEAVHSFMFCVFDLAIISVNVFLFVLPSYNTFQDTIYDNPDSQCLSVVTLFGDVAAELN